MVFHLNKGIKNKRYNAHTLFFIAHYLSGFFYLKKILLNPDTQGTIINIFLNLVLLFPLQYFSLLVTS